MPSQREESILGGLEKQIPKQVIHDSEPSTEMSRGEADRICKGRKRERAAEATASTASAVSAEAESPFQD